MGRRPRPRILHHKEDVMPDFAMSEAEYNEDCQALLRSIVVVPLLVLLLMLVILMDIARSIYSKP